VEQKVYLGIVAVLVLHQLNTAKRVA